MERSSSVNKAQLVGTPEGDVIVPSFDWTGYLAPFFRKIKSLKSYHHFLIDSQSHGFVRMRKTSDGPVTEEQHLRTLNNVPSSELPPIIPPIGLTSERQWYLYDKIREYCPDVCKDLTCPLPLSPRPAGSSRNTPDVDEVPEPAEEIEVSSNSRKRRTCTNCGQSGHNSRTCTV